MRVTSLVKTILCVEGCRWFTLNDRNTEPLWSGWFQPGWLMRAMFTLQVLSSVPVLSWDLFFFARLFTLQFKCDHHQIPVRTAYGFDVTCMCRRRHNVTHSTLILLDPASGAAFACSVNVAYMYRQNTFVSCFSTDSPGKTALKFASTHKRSGSKTYSARCTSNNLISPFIAVIGFISQEMLFHFTVWIWKNERKAQQVCRLSSQNPKIVGCQLLKCEPFYINVKKMRN